MVILSRIIFEKKPTSYAIICSRVRIRSTKSENAWNLKHRNEKVVISVVNTKYDYSLWKIVLSIEHTEMKQSRAK